MKFITEFIFINQIKINCLSLKLTYVLLLGYANII